MKYTAISFPAFGLEINPPRSFDLGPLTIHFYGLIIATGLILATYYCMKRSPQFGLNEDLVLDGVLWVTPFAFVCARAYYCFFAWDMYAGNPIKVFAIWEGGIAIYGGVIGAVIGMFLFSRWKKVDFFAVLDLVLLGFLIGQSMGRWGNFFNLDAFGSQTDAFLRMGLFNERTQSWEYHHPTFLYESVWNAAGFVILHLLSRRRKFDGQVALGYAAWYGLGRAMIEGLRTDSLYIPGTPIRVSQLLAAVTCAAAVLMLVYQAMKPQDPNKLYVVRKRMEIEEGVQTDE